MKTEIYFILACLVVLNFGCWKELPLPDADAPPLLVVNSLIAPDSLFTAHVSESCLINDINCGQINVTTASVRLKDEAGNLLETLTHTGEGIYAAPNTSITPNKSYQLEVDQTGLTSVKASSYTPKAIDCLYHGFEERFMEGTLVYAFDIEINDDPNEVNYYILEGQIEFLNEEHSDFGSESNLYHRPHFLHYSSDINAENSRLIADIDFVSYGLRAVYLSDENFNGQKYTSSFGVRDHDTRFLRGDNEMIAHLSIKSVSKEMYEYAISLEKHKLTIGGLGVEPEIIYSNIENGIGLFAGYSEKTFSQALPESDYLEPTDLFIENKGCTAPCVVKFSTDGGPGILYHWDFGDGNSSSEPNPEHTYQEPGTYQVELGYSLSTGDSSSTIGEVEIR